MLTNLDCELYPDLCEVAEMPLHRQWVYMIQKNGTSSIRDDPSTSYHILVNHEIGILEYVDVYIRNPRSRYVSGVNTFVQHTMRDHPELDPDTLIWMATRYLFLNRHYLPQILWLVNLARYLRSDSKIRIRDFRDYKNIVGIDHDARIKAASQDLIDKILVQDRGLELWFFADQILLDLAGKSMTWTELKFHYQNHHAHVWETITAKALSVGNVLS
jgi:hypothetical protein